MDGSISRIMWNRAGAGRGPIAGCTGLRPVIRSRISSSRSVCMLLLGPWVGSGCTEPLLGHGRVRLEPGLRDASGFTGRPQSVGLGLRARQAWVLPNPLVGGASSRTADKQVGAEFTGRQRRFQVHS